MSRMLVTDQLVTFSPSISLKQAYFMIGFAGAAMLLLYYASHVILNLLCVVITFIVAFAIRCCDRNRTTSYEVLNNFNRQITVPIADRKMAEKKLQISHELLQIANRHVNINPMLDEFVEAMRRISGCFGCAIHIMDPAGITYSAIKGFDAQCCELGKCLVQKKLGLCAIVMRNDMDMDGFTRFGSFWSNFAMAKTIDGTKTTEDCQCICRLWVDMGSLALIPIRLDQQISGLVWIADQREGLLNNALIEIMESAVMQIGPAISRIRAEEDLRAAYYELEYRLKEDSLELSRTNRKLQAEVEKRRLAEQRLRESRNTLQTLIDGIKDALILVDRGMRIRMLNRAAAELYNVTPDSMIGKLCRHAVGEIGICDKCKIPHSVEQGQVLAFERRIPGDLERLEQVSIYPWVEKEGRAGGAIMRIVDITGEKRYQQQLIKSEKMASLGILVSSIAHEINNPNNFVTFNIPILRSYIKELLLITDPFAENQADMKLFHMNYPEFRQEILKMLDNIEHGASRISTFVSNLREFSQNNGNLQKQWLDLRLVSEKVLSICRSQINKCVKFFELDIAGDQPPIYTNKNSLEQVLLNLIINAVQAANKSDSFVKLSACTGGNWHDHTIITIADNGCGMDEKTIGRIFEPFFTTKSAAEGTGLGLYVSHKLVQNLGGRIELESQVGVGSRFSILLPNKAHGKQPGPLEKPVSCFQPVCRNFNNQQKNSSVRIEHPVADLAKKT